MVSSPSAPNYIRAYYYSYGNGQLDTVGSFPSLAYLYSSNRLVYISWHAREVTLFQFQEWPIASSCSRFICLMLTQISNFYSFKARSFEQKQKQFISGVCQLEYSLRWTPPWCWSFLAWDPLIRNTVLVQRCNLHRYNTSRRKKSSCTTGASTRRLASTYIQVNSLYM